MFKISNLFFDEKRKYNIEHVPHKCLMYTIQVFHICNTSDLFVGYKYYISTLINKPSVHIARW